MTVSCIEKPYWLKKKLVTEGSYFSTSGLLSKEHTHTVCVSAVCPNQNECFSMGQATFLLLGDICTRRCSFCAVNKGRPADPDRGLPGRILQIVMGLGLRYVVFTSVTRDDLEDGGAAQFVDALRVIKAYKASIRTEVLTPDFMGNKNSMAMISDEGPDVFGHNIETVRRLYTAVRPGASYDRSLSVLKFIKKHKPSQITKSSIMAGLGEKNEEMFETMADLKEAGCDILTIGQYLSPSTKHIPVSEYLSPDRFNEYKARALAMGFAHVSAGPFVRSSYLAEKAFESARKGRGAI